MAFPCDSHHTELPVAVRALTKADNNNISILILFAATINHMNLKNSSLTF